MSAARIFLIVFVIIETLNMLELYFLKDESVFNGVSIFTAWEKSKQDPEIHNFVRYLVNWVAGTKLIFIMLLIVILLTASEQTQLLSAAALVLSIASFFWRLFPLIRKMDKEDQIEPKNYSVVLGWMIGGFMAVFIVPLLLALY